MTYEAWRISYQSSEQAARAAYEECMRLRAELTDLRNSMAFRTSLIGRLEAERKELLEALQTLLGDTDDSDYMTRAEKEEKARAAETAAKLQHFNDWRRGHHDDAAQPDPREIGEAIDAAIEMIERMNGALESLAIHCDDSDSAMYGTLSTSFVRDTIRIARGEQ